jgi:eukaryotic-like serine/threonine-protein kinase
MDSMDTHIALGGMAAIIGTDSRSEPQPGKPPVEDAVTTPAPNILVMDRDETAKSPGAHATVEFLMRRMHHKGDLPAFSNHIAEINSKLSSLTAINYSSVGDLAKIILKDFSLTNKLLKVVNSALYATLSGKVMTISKAVFLLGFDKVRMIAAALMIYEHLQNKTQANELKEVAIASYMSGVIAAGVAENMKRSDREEAFICAMLYNLGKMLVICYLPEEYGEIEDRTRQRGIDEGKASKSVLGVTYNELGMAISRAWNFPDKIVQSMDSIPPGVIEPPKTEQEILQNIANYSNELLSTAMNAEETNRSELMSDLSKRYHNGIPIPVEQMESFIESAAAKINDHSDIVRADQNTSSFMKKLLQTRQRPLRESSGSSAARHQHHQPLCPPVAASPASKSEDLSGEQRTSILTKGIHEIAEVIKDSRNLSDIIYMIIETMYRGFELTRVFFCLRDATKVKMVARFGLGENSDELARQFHFQIAKSPDVFNIAISQAKGIIIDDAAAPNISRNLPKWYRDSIAAPSFLIYPLLFKGECIGMFYADKKDKRIMLTEVQRRHMEDLRNMAIQALTKKYR